jgi:hypothetical protein
VVAALYGHRRRCSLSLDSVWTVGAQDIEREEGGGRGDKAGEDVEELALTLEGPDLPEETQLEAVGRITNASMAAREMLAAETVPPETDEPEPPVTDAPWVALIEDPHYPFGAG